MPGWSIGNEESGKLKGRLDVFRAGEFEQRGNMMWFTCECNPSGHTEGRKRSRVGRCIVIIIINVKEEVVH